MKIKFLISLSLLIYSLSYSQTATNFNCNDCSDINHDLFTELEAGKIIVICWVMPCGACIAPASASYNVVNDYQTNNPNKVYFYLVDDFSDNDCEFLNDWAIGIDLPSSSFSKRFSNSSISMANYGAPPSMSKVVVIASFSHKVFYNQNDVVNETELGNSINLALIASGINDLSSTSELLQIFPNPADKSIKLSIFLKEKSKCTIEIFNSLGKKIADIPTDIFLPTENTFTINTSEFKEGFYYLSLKSNKLSITRKFTIVH
ncbi:MAG: hypothetical protein A2046_05155 [Bacteroidetes bacterium GWA2_30_7]|nr:MAG: hypothetical protein A2046_05155 [Bacteroidetes bacterium GWA2_30_7]